MISSWVAVLLLSYAGAALAQFYGSLRGYACSQPTLYMQCQCPSFCGSYGSASGGYPMYGNKNGGYGGGSGGGYGGSLPRRHKKRRHHKKKKFRFETAEEPEEELPEPPSEHEIRRPSASKSSERHPPPSEPEERPGTSKHSWENEDEWEKKFVIQSKTKEPEGGSEELPEIDSEEIISAKGRADKEESELSKQTSALSPAVETRSRGGESGDVGTPVNADNTGGGRPATTGSSRLGGGGLGPSGFGGGSGSSGFGGGGGSSGLGGLGLGNGGLFGISSGIGVGIPGVGPIGVSSGLGIGR